MTETAPFAPIRARFHDNAIKRVTRMYAATLLDALIETFQNARRSGATRVRVTVAGAEDAKTVTVTDDGAGIADAAVLLSFGENGWHDELVAVEDAAGFGMLSLARRGCAVVSRPRSPDGSPAPGWRVSLAPEHFLGEAEAEVSPHDTAPWPHGTAVSFEAAGTGTPGGIRGAVETAARHYPLPVVFDDAPDTRSGGEPVERRAFLDGALHAEPWKGLVFGVFKDRWAGFGLGDPDVNFHGLTVTVRLPSVEAVTGPQWTVAADIVDCPDLELVLPARKEAVETPFLEEMREAARLAIYRAMAADSDPRPAFDDWKRARDAGIDIARPPAELRPWRAGLADIDDWREPPELESVGGDALLVACDPEPPEAQTLARAAKLGAIADRLFEPDRRLEGYGWYDAIERVVNVHTEASAGGRTFSLDEYPTPERTGGPEPRLPQRPDAIGISLAVKPPADAGRIIDLATDVAFAGEAWSWVWDAMPLVTVDSTIEPQQLAELLRAGFFSPSDESDADSWERQRDVFDTEALHVATRVVCSEDEARRTSIAEAVTRELFWLIPHERGADISVRERRVSVTLGKPIVEGAS